MKLKVAVIGSGSAGAAAALYFHRNNHEVVVFEREAKPTPVGAGIMLQPTGLNTLADLGLAEKALRLGQKISGLYGEDEKSNAILDVAFKNNENLTGLGINRGALYFLMFDELVKQGINIKLGTEIVDIKDEDEKKTIIDRENGSYKGFDLVIVANGARSMLRKGKVKTKIDRAQEYGALWAKLPYDNAVFKNRIYQKYKGAHTMIGFMPMGRLDENSPEEVNFFWSIKVSDIEQWKNDDLEKWKSEVKAFCPEFKEVIDLIKSKDQIMIAPYLDVVLKPSYRDRIVFIGDAAHPMSPQLAQGAGFAMLDARILSENIEAHAQYIEQFSENINIALRAYHQQRSKQVYFYQTLSRWLTPLFQSKTSNTIFRDNMFFTIRKLSLFKGLMNATILGYRESLFKNIDKKYYSKAV